MTANAGYHLFTTGDVLTAAQVQYNLQNQTIMYFANSAARTSALSGVLVEGMFSYLADTNSTEYYDGSAWASISNPGDITGVTAGTGLSGGGTSGTVSLAIDTATTVDKTTAQTLTNKTLTSPALTTPTISTYTTNGDLVYGTGSGAISRLGIGSSSQVLTVSGGVPAWATPATSSSGLVFISKTSFSATSSQSINNVFSATYENYIVDINISASSATCRQQVRMRVSGADNTSANYSFGYARYATNDINGRTAAGDSALTEFLMDYNVTGYTSQHIINFCNPFLSTVPTSYLGNQILQLGPTVFSAFGQETGATTVNTSYTGFTIFPETGTITGTITVYGKALA